MLGPQHRETLEYAGTGLSWFWIQPSICRIAGSARIVEGVVGPARHSPDRRVRRLRQRLRTLQEASPERSPGYAAARR